MFNGRIQPREFRFFIKHLLLVITNHFIEVVFYIYDINEITMLIKFAAFKLQLKDVMMRIGKILWPPVSAN